MRLCKYLMQAGAANQHKLYDTHIPTNGLQKLSLAVSSAIVSVLNPERGDAVATLGDTTGHEALHAIRLKMVNHAVGEKILRDRPELNSRNLDLKILATLPENTLGKTYANFMINHGLDADSRAPPQFVDDEELAYVINRYRQVHDFVHTIVGGTNVSVLTELAVKWFEMMQTQLPMTVLASFFGPLALTQSERWILLQHYIPWALYAGSRADFFMNIKFEQYLEWDLVEFQKKYNIVPMPILK